MRKYRKVDYENGTKQCADCGEDKPLEGFPIRKDGYVYAYCKLCNARRTREWSAKNRERKAASGKLWADKNPERTRAIAKDGHYRRSYGVGVEEVQKLLELQSFCCAICGVHFEEKRYYVDHCHTGGDVRGILCNRCNIGLASIERPGYLDAALAYLERHRSKS